MKDLVLQLTIALQLKGDVLRVCMLCTLHGLSFTSCNLITTARCKDMLDTSYDNYDHDVAFYFH